jgi:hypothetical protein
MWHMQGSGFDPPPCKKNVLLEIAVRHEHNVHLQIDTLSLQHLTPANCLSSSEGQLDLDLASVTGTGP